MLHKLKPVPRALVILAIVGVAGFALTTVDFAKLMPKKAAPAAEVAVEAPAVTTVTAPASPPPNSAVPAAPAPAPAPAQAAAPSGLTPATNDAGLDAVLRAKK
jgi:pyruvate dehydrogenase E2 component (dihydrolipoamide acetyltransferase)